MFLIPLLLSLLILLQRSSAFIRTSSGTSTTSGNNNFLSRLKQRFRSSFEETCSSPTSPSYPFVDKFRELAISNHNRYLVFVLHDPRDGDNLGVGGGQGDTMAGIVTAAMASIALNRTFVIQSRDVFSNRFEQWFDGNDDDGDIDSDKRRRRQMRNETLANYLALSLDSKNVQTRMENCVHEFRGGCAFNQKSEDIPIIRYRSNRCLLCLWTNTNDGSYLWDLSKFKVTESSNLIEVAGCLSRLAVWPKAFLWDELKRSLGAFADKDIHHLIGAHFRCGDPAFLDSSNKDATSNDPYLLMTFKKFVDRNPSDLHHICSRYDHTKTADNPENVGNCANLHLKQMNSLNYNDSALYIAADHQIVKSQIVKIANWGNTITFSGECWGQAGLCAANNYVHWFMLSLSEKIVTRTVNNVFLYSSFSRSAGIYSLQKSVYFEAKNCLKTHDNKEVGRVGNGNWICVEYPNGGYRPPSAKRSHANSNSV